MNNSFLGKTMENLSQIINVRLVNNAKDYKKYVSKPGFASQKIFSKNIVAIYEIKPVVILDKPIHVGFSILDLSKLLLYESHYKYVKSKFDANLLFTDKDSLVYEIKTEDVYEDFYEEKICLILVIIYSVQSFLILLIKVIGKMKDEFKGKIISEITGLNSKMYSLIDVDDEGVEKAK